MKEVSKTGRSSVFLTQQSDKSLFFLKQIPKNLSCTLDYSEVILDPEKFAIPISIWEDAEFLYEKISYYEGWSLEEIIKLNNGGIGGILIESWLYELLELLEILHSHTPPIIHRDLKPANIFVRADSLKLMLLDLSSAVFFNPNATYDSVGTEGYATQKQFAGKPSPFSDLYALAATIFKMNSGMEPPSFFDRQRGKAKLYLENVPAKLAYYYPSIASIPDWYLSDLKEVSDVVNPYEPYEPRNAVQAIALWNFLSNSTASGKKKLKPIKFPNGSIQEQYVLLGAGSISVSV